jgi:hypothetical protein
VTWGNVEIWLFLRGRGELAKTFSNMVNYFWDNFTIFKDKNFWIECILLFKVNLVHFFVTFFLYKISTSPCKTKKTLSPLNWFHVKHYFKIDPFMGEPCVFFIIIHFVYVNSIIYH